MVSVQDILAKKELRGISEEYATAVMNQWLVENNIDVSKKKEQKKMKSAIREILRNDYGVFFEKKYSNKREERIQTINKDPTIENIKELLELHRSTHERVYAYDFLYEQLFSYTKQPTSILDLGCGFNPFTAPLTKASTYHCIDIACQDLQAIDTFLSLQEIEHTTTCKDLTKIDFTTLPHTDVTFAFKILDGLEEKEPGFTRRLIQTVNSDYLIISFALASIGQKKPIEPRKWIEPLVTNREVGRVTLPNEQFIIITT